MDNQLQTGIKGGAEYFARSFLGGLVLGFGRIFILEQVVSSRLSMMVMLPSMLVWSWISSQKAAASQHVSGAMQARLAMGATAFGCLKLAEYLLLNKSSFEGSNLLQRAASLEAWQGGSGLAGTILFALFPFIQAAIV